ncbi:MAG: ferrous iron transporter B, partial [Spirochaetes bacterium]|nr:ferrous iron transporter B [Spirochaetota bacterium]
FSIYLVGILFAVLTGLLMKKTLFQGEASYFVMELPPYHVPRVKHILLHTWDRLKAFIFRAGKAIIITVAVLAVLNSLGTDGTIGNEDSEKSVLAAIGRSITPVFAPLGIEQENWPATVGLFTGLFAKEAVVGTLKSLYGQIAAANEAEEGGEVEEEGGFDFWGGIAEAFASIPEALGGVFGGLSDPLGTGLISETDQEVMAEEIGADTSIFGMMGQYFSQGKNQAYAYLLFILLYFPCVAAFGAVVKETGWLIGTINAAYLTILGWVVATLYYQLTTGFNVFWIVFSIILMGLVIFGFYLMRNMKTFREPSA